jgi:1,4-dihydroxy-2-naphthoyl-CoA synthase
MNERSQELALAAYEDITYAIDEAAAVITTNRPERYNAFRGKTVEQLIKAFRAAWADSRVSAIILTGGGDKAFCTGGDVKQREQGAETGDYGPTESGMFEIDYLHKLIRDRIALPQAIVRRRHRSPGRSLQHGDVRAGDLRAHRRGHGRRAGIRREADTRLRPVRHGLRGSLA